MPADANAVLQASTTKAATFNGAGMDIKGGTPRRGMFVRVVYSAATSTTTNTATFSVDESSDNATFFQKTVDNADVLNLTTAAQSGEIFIPIETSKRYIRLSVTVAGAGTASVTYKGEIVAGRP